jgi:hypothetical protein
MVDPTQRREFVTGEPPDQLAVHDHCQVQMALAVLPHRSH